MMPQRLGKANLMFMSQFLTLQFPILLMIINAYRTFKFIGTLPGEVW